MATLYITEYAGLAEDKKGRTVLVGSEPALRSTSFAFTTSAQSAELKKGTSFVRLVSDADCFVKFGPNPTAATGALRILADQPEYFGVSGRDGLKIAAYDGS